MSEIRRQDLISDDAIKAPLELRNNLEQVIASMDKLIERGKASEKAVGASMSISKLKDETVQLTDAQKELDKIQKQIATTQAKNTEEYRSQEKALAAVKSQLKEKVILGDRDAKSITAQNSSLKVLEAALNKNREAYRNMTAAQRNNSKEGQELIKIIQQQDKESKALSASIGQNQKEVGNYTGAIKAALGPLGNFGGGMSQLTVGLGATNNAMKGAATGANILRVAMMAIPIFLIIAAITTLVDWFRKTDEGATLLAGVMRALGQVMDMLFSWIRDIGVALSELTWDKVIQGVKDFGDSIKNYILGRIELLMKGIKGLGTAFQLLFSGEFTAAAKQAGEAFLDIQRGANPIAMLIEAAVDAGVALVDIIKDVSAEVKKAVLDSIALEKEFDRIADRARELGVIEAESAKQITGLLLQSKNVSLSYEERIKLLREASAIEERTHKLQLQNAIDLEKAVSKEVEMKRAVGKLNDDIDKKQKDAQIARIHLQTESIAIQEKIANRESALLEAKTAEEERQRKKRIEEATKDALKLVAIEQERINKTIEAIKQEAIDGIRTRTQAEKDIAEVKKFYADSVVQSNIDAVNKILSNEELNAEERAEVEKKLAQLKIDLQDAVFNKIEDTNAKTVDFVKVTLDEITDAYNNFSNSIGNIFSNITERRLQELDIQSEANAEALGRELEMAGDNEDAKERLKQEFAAREAEIERKRREEVRKAAVKEKAIALTQAAIGTAVAVVNALRNPPGVPYTIPFGVLAGVLGAAQIAAIASKPIPAFAEGGTTRTSVVIAGEEGAEIYKTPSGRVGLTPDTASIMWLPVGTEIKPHDETMKLLALSGINEYGNGLLRQNSNDNQLLMEIKNGFSSLKNKKEVYINFSRKGAEIMMRNAESRIKFLNDFFR